MGVITYDDIARMIEPVATREVDEEHEVMNIGDFILRRWGTGYWTILHPTAAQAADLACMELVRRLNEKKHTVVFRPGNKVMLIKAVPLGHWNTGDHPESISAAWINHPLEAIAPFAAEVLGKETP